MLQDIGQCHGTRVGTRVGPQEPLTLGLEALVVALDVLDRAQPSFNSSPHPRLLGPAVALFQAHHAPPPPISTTFAIHLLSQVTGPWVPLMEPGRAEAQCVPARSFGA